MEDKLISDVHDDGSFIELDDGSVWEVSPADKDSAKSWAAQQRVQVTKAESGSYLLTNLDAPDQGPVSATI